MKYLTYALAIFTDVLQLALFLLFWALEPVTAVSGPLGIGLDMAISVVFGFVLMILLTEKEMLPLLMQWAMVWLMIKLFMLMFLR